MTSSFSSKKTMNYGDPLRALLFERFIKKFPILTSNMRMCETYTLLMNEVRVEDCFNESLKQKGQK